MYTHKFAGPLANWRVRSAVSWFLSILTSAKMFLLLALAKSFLLIKIGVLSKRKWQSATLKPLSLGATARQSAYPKRSRTALETSENHRETNDFHYFSSTLPLGAPTCIPRAPKLPLGAPTWLLRASTWPLKLQLRLLKPLKT